MYALEHHLDQNQYDYHPFESYMMDIIQMIRKKIHKFDAMIQFLIHHFGSFTYIQMAIGS